MNTSRINRVRENMAAVGLDQILVTSPLSVYYLTGTMVAPGERMFALYLNANGEIKLFANRLFALNGNVDVPLAEFDDTEDPIALLSASVKPGKLGVDKTWPSQFTIRLMEALPGMVPVVGSAPVDDARMCKDAEEIALMRESSRMNDEAIARTIAGLHEGMTELELEELYLKNAKAVGGEGGSFTPISCFGANCAEPHHDNDETRLKAGDAVILDVGLMHRRYCSDMTRTVFFKSATDEQKRVYDVCRRANEAGRAAVRPGLPMCEFDRAARKVIEDAGYGKYFIHRTGHGIGLEVHEHPDNSSTSQIIARPGMCFSVEPGIYLPGHFGVRVEDLVVVTDDGCETLNLASRALCIVEG